MKRSGLLVMILLLVILLVGLIICLSFASKKDPSRVKLVCQQWDVGINRDGIEDRVVVMQ